MRIVHTSDWHLGKNLEGYSRIDEQELFLNDFVEIVRDKKAELVVIAGDIYDNGNPPAKAEALFYRCIKRLSEECCCGIVIIAGNHDNPERLEAVVPLAKEHGILILGTPKSYTEIGHFNNLSVLSSEEGVAEIEVKGEKAVILTMPYPSEKRLGEIISDDSDEANIQKDYSVRIGEIFKKLSESFRSDTINLAISHLYVAGGETSDSERSIQLGGSFSVQFNNLPLTAQYIALGHLHKTQSFEIEGCPIVYSGSPLKYSKKERNNKNSIYLIDVKAGEKAVVERIILKVHKPIEIWRCSSLEEAIEKCKEECNREVWVYLEIKCDSVIPQQFIKAMRDYKKDIIEIKPIINAAEEEVEEMENLTEIPLEDVFSRFYSWKNNVTPSQELIDLLLEITHEED